MGTHKLATGNRQRPTDGPGRCAHGHPRRPPVTPLSTQKVPRTLGAGISARPTGGPGGAFMTTSGRHVGARVVRTWPQVLETGNRCWLMRRARWCAHGHHRRPPSGATPDTEGFKLDSGSVSESPACRPAGVTDPLAATGASESRVRVSLGSQLAAGPQGPVSRRGYRHVTGIVPHKIPGPADACNIQAPTGTAGYNLWKTRHLQKGVQGGRRYTEGVLIQRPLAKSIQVRSMSLARV